MTTFKPFKTFSKLVLVTNILLTLTLFAIIGEASGILFGCLAFFNLIFALPISLLLTRIQSCRSGLGFWIQSKPRKQRLPRVKSRIPKSSKTKKGFSTLGSQLFSSPTVGLDHKGDIAFGDACIEI